MTQYLGISMVVIVIAMCIGILSTIVSEAIFKQIEAHRRRVAERNMVICGKLMEGFGKYINEYSNGIKEIAKTCKKMEDDGIQMDMEFKKKVADAAINAAKKATDEMKNE